MSRDRWTNDETAATASFIGEMIINDEDMVKEFASLGRLADPKPIIDLAKKIVNDYLGWQGAGEDKEFAGKAFDIFLKRVDFAQIAESHIRMALASGRASALENLRVR